MRMDLTLNVTLEGSLCDLPAFAGGTEETAETPKTHLKVATERGPTQVESPRRIERIREASREEAIASTRHFFATVNRQNGTTTELPAETTADVSGGNAPLNIPVVSSTPIETETTEGETRSPRTFLPNGSPSRPTATATCRLQTWVQHVSEGQINEPTREGEDSGGSNPSEPYVLVEGIPDELGHEWRVLHPFEIPEVRFPTDNTSPNQRRLAENDALVELIQTTEYLEDMPIWGQRDYRLYPPRYGDPFYRRRGRGRGRGRRDWMGERPFERETNGGSGSGFFHGNGRGAVREAHWTTSESEQRDRQEEDWSIPASIERRDDSPVRQGLQRTPLLHLSWMKDFLPIGVVLESPHARTSPQSVPIRETGQSINQPDNQTTQPG